MSDDPWGRATRFMPELAPIRELATADRRIIVGNCHYDAYIVTGHCTPVEFEPLPGLDDGCTCLVCTLFREAQDEA